MTRTPGGKGDTHKKWSSLYPRKVTFVLASVDHKLVLVPSKMQLRIKKAEYGRNIYEGDVTAAWRALHAMHRSLEFIGVLYADSQREFNGDIGWVEETPLSENKPDRAVLSTASR